MKSILILIPLLLLGCKHTPKTDTQDQLAGTWTAVHDPHYQIQFTDDHFFYRIRNGAVIENKFHELNKVGQYEEVDYGDLTYLTTPYENDSIACHFVGSKNKKTYAKETFIINDNQLTEITYKILPGIEHHIDEVVFYTKEGTTLQENNSRIEKIILQQGASREYYIAYGVKDGQPPQFDSLGNRMLSIPSDGILKTSLIEDPEIMAAQGYKFYEQDSITGQLTRLPEFQYGNYRQICKALRDRDKSVQLKYPINSTALFVLGFNQAPRDVIDADIFKEKIDGNVLIFSIDTIKNKIMLENYSKMVDK